MTAKAKAPKAPKASPVYSPVIVDAYGQLINSATTNNQNNLDFIVYLNGRKESQAIKQSSIRQALQNVEGATPIIKVAHVPNLDVACLVIVAFKNEKIKAEKILTVASRVRAEFGIAGAPAHIAKFKTFSDLDKGTKSSAENQADKAEESGKESGKVAKVKTVDELMMAFLSDLNKIAKAQATTADKLTGKNLQMVGSVQNLVTKIAINSAQGVTLSKKVKTA